MTSEYTHMLISLFGVLVLLIACIYMVKKFKLANNIGNKQIKILNAVPVGPKERMLLVEVNNTVLLIGATPSHIETLYVFNPLEATQSASQATFADQIATLSQNDLNKAPL